MLRIHFTGTDLVRTRVAPRPDPMWELALSIHLLRMRGTDPLLSGWKSDTVARLRPAGPLRAEVAMLLALNPPVGYFPDFLTPPEAADGIDAGLDAVLSTAQPRLRREIDVLGGARGSLPASVDELGRGNRSAIAELGTAITRYHQTAIEPMWPRVRAAVEADRGMRARTMLDQGVEGLLNDLHPSIRFDGGTLSIADYPSHRDVHLDGRGLLLVPSYFKTYTKPVTLVDPELPPVLVYSVHPAARLAVTAPGEALTGLLGRTRAAVLELAAAGSTTTELSRRLGVSPAAVSQHVTVMRDAGLLLSTRIRNTVHHTLTPLGHALLAGSPR
ncbi:ArsR/SmtB family transcription factor [Catellatospora tritici]|uniref:ArsR/SmtB family transcription factor n=1 Tax=Catellatospora tritici TaxID=2851566 RepID=UPI001C2CCD56|nr:winged helix-turn-helix domain-containing protein [Catellatospora tritici]MBV1849517.1 winged helix-turn-helix domain-containing protein [Catellatospora tritici]MBV1854089.1 winged helix-turn-helix domain-containing protein [Catellatospora tritici]